MFKKLLPFLLTALVLSGCSSGSDFEDSPALDSDSRASSYIEFQNKLNASFNEALYVDGAKLVTTTTDSNYDENDSVDIKLYFKSGEDKYRGVFPLSGISSSTSSIKSYYSSCKEITEMFIVEPFATGTVNSYEASRHYIDGNKLWQVITDKSSGLTVQYFELNDDGLIVKQEAALLVPPLISDENVKSTIESTVNWRLGDVKNFLSNSADKTTITYSYDDYEYLNPTITAEKWLEIGLNMARTPSQPIFVGDAGILVRNVASTSDGLQCVIKS
jgi:hypothetical protein